MAALTLPKAYAEVNVLLIYFKGDYEAEKNAKILGRACKHLGYQVARFDQYSLGLLPTHNRFEDTEPGLKTWIRDWIRQCLGASNTRREQLFFVYFGGHGQVWTHDDGEHLVGSFEERKEKYEISLTRIQQLVRDESGMDLVCLFECCHADTPCLEKLEEGDLHYSSSQIVETLAGGKGTINLDKKPDEFSQRFAREMFALGGRPDAERTVKSIYNRVKDRRVYRSAGHYRCNQGQPSITLPVMANSTPLIEDDQDTSDEESDEDEEEGEEDGRYDYS